MTLPEHLRDRLASIGRRRHFRAGERLPHEGARPTAVLVILDGAVRIVASTPDGCEVTLAVRSTGDLVGDHSVLTGAPTDAAAVGARPGQVAVVPRGRFLELLEEDPAALLAETRRVIDRLRESDARLVGMATVPVATRVARELLRFTPERGGTIVVALSHEELGSLCGASRWTVAEVLSGWRTAGIVDTGRRRVVVRDPAALGRYAGT